MEVLHCTGGGDGGGRVYELELGPFFLPKVSTTLTNLLLYWILLLARPVFFFFFSPASTLGVCPLTLPARAREPCTLPPFNGMVRSMVWFSNTARFTSSSSGAPEQMRFNCSQSTPSSMESWALKQATSASGETSRTCVWFPFTISCMVATKLLL